MLRNLLAERFQLKFHRETRELPGYTLVAVKKGPKLKDAPALPGGAADDSAKPALKLGADGYFLPPDRPGIFVQMTRPPGARMVARKTTMAELTELLQRQMKRPVTEATGLSGKYDFTLDYSTEGMDLGRGPIPVSSGRESEPPQDIIAAMQSQLGLKLEPRKIPVEVLVIDQAAKVPTEN